ncbi:MAG: SPOR domain-containing protein [Vicinamibacteria bacterium]|nr:SPOR domain-containing protein [Vicinamibacteria bacterium]
MAQDEYHYEIQLTNKQLIFYFLAGATGLILAFLAGIMVGGSSLDAGGAGKTAARQVREEPVAVVNEEPTPVITASRPENLTYAQRLDSDRVPTDTLQGSKPAVTVNTTPAPAPSRSASAAATPAPAPSKTAAGATPTPASIKPAPTPAVKTTPAPKASPTLKPALVKATPAPKAGAPGTHTIQVGAFKDGASAESVMTRLKEKGFPAYVVAVEGGGHFTVRVGTYAARVDAERIKTRLEEQGFKPFIVKN